MAVSLCSPVCIDVNPKLRTSQLLHYCCEYLHTHNFPSKLFCYCLPFLLPMSTAGNDLQLHPCLHGFGSGFLAGFAAMF